LSTAGIGAASAVANSLETTIEIRYIDISAHPSFAWILRNAGYPVKSITHRIAVHAPNQAVHKANKAGKKEGQCGLVECQ